MKLYKRVSCKTCRGAGADPECPDCRGSRVDFVELDPADLLAVTKELELGYYGLVGELKGLKNRANGFTADQIRQIIADLESGLDPEKLKAMQKVREEARAFQILYNQAEESIYDDGLPEDTPNTFDDVLAQARADLKTPDKPFAKAQDKPKEEPGGKN